MTRWFISDTHFSHANIIKYCNRPFLNETEMDERLREKWNAVVQPFDRVYHLGDLCICRPRKILGFLKSLNGKKRLIRGNHDIYDTREYIEAGFEEVYGCRVLDNLIFTHIPIHPASLARFAANVHGHIHNNQSRDFPPVLCDRKGTLAWTPYINLSVEVTGYFPVSFEEVKERVRDACKDLKVPDQRREGEVAFDAAGSYRIHRDHSSER